MAWRASMAGAAMSAALSRSRRAARYVREIAHLAPPRLDRHWVISVAVVEREAVLVLRALATEIETSSPREISSSRPPRPQPKVCRARSGWRSRRTRTLKATAAKPQPVSDMAWPIAYRRSRLECRADIVYRSIKKHIERASGRPHEQKESHAVKRKGPCRRPGSALMRGVIQSRRPRMREHAGERHSSFDESHVVLVVDRVVGRTQAPSPRAGPTAASSHHRAHRQPTAVGAHQPPAVSAPKLPSDRRGGLDQLVPLASGLGTSISPSVVGQQPEPPPPPRRAPRPL